MRAAGGGTHKEEEINGRGSVVTETDGRGSVVTVGSGDIREDDS